MFCTLIILEIQHDEVVNAGYTYTGGPGSNPSAGRKETQ